MVLITHTMAIVESLAGECSSFCYFLALSPARSNLPVNTHGKPGAHCSVLLIQCRPDTLGLTMLTTIHWRSSSDVPLMLYRRSSSTVHSLAYSGIRFGLHLPSRIPAHTHFTNFGDRIVGCFKCVRSGRATECQRKNET